MDETHGVLRSQSAQEFDVLGLGSVAVDEMLYVDAWPAPDEKLRVQHRERRCGGLTGVALLAAAKLGARCAYAGRLGYDPASQFIEETFHAAGIDTAHTTRGEDCRVVQSTIIVATRTATRNVFSHSPGGTGADEAAPPAEVIEAARVLCVDHHGIAGSIRAARIARAAGRAVVADFERWDDPRFAELFASIDHVILSLGFAQRLTRCADAPSAVNAIWTAERKLAAVTDGAHGCWFRTESDARVRHQPALPIEAVDTTSCGDVFHGAYAAALAEDRSIDDALRFATVAASLKAGRRGGSDALPTREEIAAAIDRLGPALVESAP
ncbi:MAG: PfkB family carbohydrate kinase [Chthoniobacteraceae bacterium]